MQTAYNQIAILDQPYPDPTGYTSTVVPCEAYGASPNATGAANTAAIQSALNQTGYVTLTTPGTYAIASSLVIYSNTTLFLAPGVTLQLQASLTTATPILVNYAQTVWATQGNGVQAGPLTISAGNLTSSGTTCTAVFNQPHNCAVGDWICVWNVTTGLTVSGTSTNGSANVTMTTTNITTGMVVTGPGIPSGSLTTVIGITATGITMSQNATTAAGAGAGNFVFSPYNAGSGDGYGGVHQVTAVNSSTSLSYVANGPLGTTTAIASQLPTYGALTMSAMKCDTNIAVVGGGTFDYNNAVNDSATVSFNKMTMQFTGVYGLVLRDLMSINGRQSCYTMSAVRKVRIYNCGYNGGTVGAQKCDGLDAVGNIFDMEIDGWSGRSDSNDFGIGTASYVGYAQTTGPVRGVTVSNHCMNNSRGPVIYGDCENFMSDFTARNFTGFTQSGYPAMFLIDAGPAGGGTPKFRNITLDNIAVDTNTSSMIAMQGIMGSWVRIMNCRLVNQTQTNIAGVSVGTGSAYTYYQQVLVQNCRIDPTTTAQALFAGAANCTVDEVILGNCTINGTSVSFGIGLNNNAGVINRATVTNTRMEQGNALVSCAVNAPSFSTVNGSGNGTNISVTISATSYLNGVNQIQVGQLVTLSNMNPAGYNGTYFVSSVSDATHFSLRSTLSLGSIVSGTATVTPSLSVKLSGNVLNNTSFGVSMSGNSFINVYADNNTFNTNQGAYRDASASGKIKVWSSGSNFYLWNADGSRKTFVPSASQTFEAHGFDLAVDPIAVCDAVSGSMCYSIRTGAVNQGPAIYTFSLGSWVALGTGAAGVNTIIT